MHDSGVYKCTGQMVYTINFTTMWSFGDWIMYN